MANFRAGKRDRRGSSHDKRVRKLYLLWAYGDGHTCPCVHCGCTVTYETVESDRIVPGGSYERKNVQPSCRKCNIARGNDRKWRGPNPQRIKPRADRFVPDPILLASIKNGKLTARGA